MIVAMDSELDLLKQAVIDTDTDNNARMQALIGGHTGLPVQFPPGTFENLKLITYVEYLLEHTLGEEHLERAKLRYGTRAGEILRQGERQAMQAKITHVTGIVGVNQANTQ